VFTQATLRRDVDVRQSKNADGVVRDWNTTSCNTQIRGRFLPAAVFGIANALIAVKQALRSWITARLETTPTASDPNADRKKALKKMKSGFLQKQT
jgi:hypothetical protein